MPSTAEGMGIAKKTGQSQHVCFHADGGNTTPPLLQPSPLSLVPGTLAAKPYLLGRGLQDVWLKGRNEKCCHPGFPTNRSTGNPVWKLHVDSPPGTKASNELFGFSWATELRKASYLRKTWVMEERDQNKQDKSSQEDTGPMQDGFLKKH